jgi:nicotinamide riboside kinase
MRVVNLFAGPGTGKSTTCAALFAECKYFGVNTEMVLEYAKDMTWERRGDKAFKAQEFIFGQQSFALSKVASEVDFAITDAPLMLSTVYGNEEELSNLAYATHMKYDSLNIFLKRNKAYQKAGRSQTEEEARTLDARMLGMLESYRIPYVVMDFGRQNVPEIMRLLASLGWLRGSPVDV